MPKSGAKSKAQRPEARIPSDVKSVLGLSARDQSAVARALLSPPGTNRALRGAAHRYRREPR